MRDQLFIGDVLEQLRNFPDGEIQTCVTSPPYWGLRDYGVEGQLGLEPTPDDYVRRVVEIFREVRRVLRDDGTLWLNLGDSYAQARGHGHWESRDGKGDEQGQKMTKLWAKMGAEDIGLQPKDMIGIPWRVAFALQADGWILRSDIIWHKPNAMPEPVKDRVSKAHEYVFMFSKSRSYFYDQESIREPHTMKPQRRLLPVEGRESFGNRQAHTEAGYRNRDDVGHPNGRNKRSVWSINTKPYKGAHFAVMPEDLARVCIKGGSKTGSLVLDPFAGSGTTLAVAVELGRSYVGIELNPTYSPLIEERLRPALEYRNQRMCFDVMEGLEQE